MALPFILYGVGVVMGAAIFGDFVTHGTQPVSVPAAGSKPAATIKAVVKLNDATPDATILAQEAATPASANFTVAGPYTLNIKTGTSTWGTYADTPEALAAQLKYCPSHICSSTAGLSWIREATLRNVSVDYTAANLQVGTSAATVSSAFPDTHGAGPRLRLTYYANDAYSVAANLRVLIVPATGGAECPAGYTFNAAAPGLQKCDLSDAEAAYTADAENGVCLIAGSGSYNQADPDCARIAQNGNLAPVPGGVQIRDNAQNPAVATTITAQQGEKMISLLTKLSDGAYTRTDQQITATGQVGAANTTHYPNSPPPAYPGDVAGVGGGGVPGGSTGGGSTGGGSTCGGPGQPACNMQLAAASEGAGFGTAAPGDFGSKFSDLQQSNVAVSTQCPRDALQITMPLPDIAGGPLPLDGGIMCDALADYDDLIRQLNIILGFVGATFIVLRA